MRLGRWADRSLVDRHACRNGCFQSLMTRATRYTLTVNLQTAKALGITIPLRADEVIR